MDMPVAVQDLSSEILMQPVVITDQPSAMAAMIEQAAPDEVPASALGDNDTSELVGTPDDLVDTPGSLLDTPGELVDMPSALVDTPGEEPFVEAAEPSVELATDVASFDDETVTADVAETSANDQELLSPTIDYTFAAEPSLDDLVDEILRRGVEPDLPEVWRRGSPQRSPHCPGVRRGDRTRRADRTRRHVNGVRGPARTGCR